MWGVITRLKFKLFEGQTTLCVEALGTRDVIVNVDTSALLQHKKPPSEPLTELNAPLPIYLNSLSLANTRVQIDDMAITQ